MGLHVQSSNKKCRISYWFSIFSCASFRFFNDSFVILSNEILSNIFRLENYQTTVFLMG
eukprot:03063.XXX_14892_15068_1 [CDS] Oithona nana genome sequencing.